MRRRLVRGVLLFILAMMLSGCNNTSYNRLESALTDAAKSARYGVGEAYLFYKEEVKLTDLYPNARVTEVPLNSVMAEPQMLMAGDTLYYTQGEASAGMYGENQKITLWQYSEGQKKEEMVFSARDAENSGIIKDIPKAISEEIAVNPQIGLCAADNDTLIFTLNYAYKVEYSPRYLCSYSLADKTFRLLYDFPDEKRTKAWASESKYILAGDELYFEEFVIEENRNNMGRIMVCNLSTGEVSVAKDKNWSYPFSYKNTVGYMKNTDEYTEEMMATAGGEELFGIPRHAFWMMDGKNELFAVTCKIIQPLQELILKEFLKSQYTPAENVDANHVNGYAVLGVKDGKFTPIVSSLEGRLVQFATTDGDNIFWQIYYMMNEKSEPIGVSYYDSKVDKLVQVDTIMGTGMCKASASDSYIAFYVHEQQFQGESEAKFVLIDKSTL